jgi:very-short-patch-repair endonuclease
MKLGSMNHSVKQNVRARRLRAEMSTSERVLWEHLRKKRLGYSFRRQVPVGPYILDFYCAQASLCIEVDGEQHEESRWRDAKRDAYLREVGIETIRIPSLDLFAGDSAAFLEWLRKIGDACAARSPASLRKPPPSENPLPRNDRV